METIVFTNGCFDIIHPGHIDLLKQARSLGTKLIVGLNSDRSVREIKGASRPLVSQESRAAVLRELRSVDEVRIFDENTPERIIKEIKPHVLVKGGDWKPEQIIGADYVLENGGRVFSIPFKQNVSTSQLVEKIRTDEKKVVSEKHQIEFEEILTLPAAASDLQRGAELIADVLSLGNKIYIADFSDFEVEAKRFTEDFASYFGSEKLTFIKTSEDAELFKTSAESGDLLIGIVGESATDDFARIVMEARQRNICLLILTDENGRKLAGLSDANVFFEARSKHERLWKLQTIGYLWLRSFESKNNIF
jgi:rfaE bifunctional protein nucleotidyltransferase chain/domain